jgi:predicted Fe-Mo cluster-binding NifX family protein
MIRKGRIAVPSDVPGGVKGERSEHFGHCPLFTIVQVRDGVIDSVTTVDNVDHGAGDCMLPVRLLHEHKLDAVVVAGLGAGPLRGLDGVGIKVFMAGKDEYPYVDTVVHALLADRLPLMAPVWACQGKGNCHGH